MSHLALAYSLAVVLAQNSSKNLQQTKEKLASMILSCVHHTVLHMYTHNMYMYTCMYMYNYMYMYMYMHQSE